MLLSTLRRDMLSVTSSPPSHHMLPQLLHMLPQLPLMPLICHTHMLESTILANVKPKLTPNSHTTTTPMLDSHTQLDTPDILDTPDTPPHTPTATCGTDTTTKDQDLKYIMFFIKKVLAHFNLVFKLTFYQVPDSIFFIFANFPSATTEIWQIVKFQR